MSPNIGIEPKHREGVVGLLRGARPGRTVLLRADMDALPIHEENDVAYRSRTDGGSSSSLNARSVFGADTSDNACP